jgi:hypothetical protein
MKCAYFFVSITVISFLPVRASVQSDSLRRFVTIHFLYGSIPGKGHQRDEGKYFGGLHGGHVLLQLDTGIFSFYPNGERFHIFAHKKEKHGEYVLENLSDWVSDTGSEKYTSITFPISDSQYVALKKIEHEYLRTPPYDYALFGMRCAAAAYDVLGRAGVVKQYSHFHNICINFYPQPMRKRMLKYARLHHLKITKHDGRASRLWERD